LNDWVQAGELAAFFVAAWLVVVLLSVGLVVRPYQMRDDMPSAIRLARRLALKRGEVPGFRSAIYGSVLIFFFLLPGILAFDPFLRPRPMPVKIVSALYLVAAGIWFVYLFRLVRRGPRKP
jgi:hypothetical protein